VDLNSLPPGVTIHPTQVGNGWWLANDSDRPLILEERFAPDGQLDWGIKLVSGKIYHYYRSRKHRAKSMKVVGARIFPKNSRPQKPLRSKLITMANPTKSQA
jgi:hypothetical protein